LITQNSYSRVNYNKTVLTVPYLKYQSKTALKPLENSKPGSYPVVRRNRNPARIDGVGMKRTVTG